MFPFLIKLWQWVLERMPFPWQQICTALANEATTVSFLSGEMSGNGQVLHSSEAVAQACLLSSPFERFVGQFCSANKAFTAKHIEGRSQLGERSRALLSWVCGRATEDWSSSVEQFTPKGNSQTLWLNLKEVGFEWKEERAHATKS